MNEVKGLKYSKQFEKLASSKLKRITQMYIVKVKWPRSFALWYKG